VEKWNDELQVSFFDGGQGASADEALKLARWGCEHGAGSSSCAVWSRHDREGYNAFERAHPFDMTASIDKF
jgi:hypothetical protein